MINDTDQEHFQREISEQRRANRGDVLKLAAYFECPERLCPVTQIRVMISETLGRTKPMQKPCRCLRCQSVLDLVRIES
jgi:hypothetical protein